MVLWHVAATLFLFRWIFRDPKVDVRFLVGGALLPDVIDLTVGTVVAAERFSSGELWFHTLLVPTLLSVAILLVTRRGRRRRAWMALVVGMLFHLLLDGMWTSAEVFLWPLFGFDFPAQPRPYWPNALDRAVADEWRWILEAVGILYLGWMWRAAGLSDPSRRAVLLETGRLDAEVSSS